MSWIAALRSEFGAIRRGRTGRDTQLRADTARLFILTAAGFSKSLPAGVSDVALDDLPPFGEQAEHVASHLSSSAASLISGGAVAPGRSAASSSRRKKNTGDPFPVRSMKKMHSSHLHRLSFDKAHTVEVRESGIPGAGLGVHVKGIIEAGSLITLYPGVTYRPSDVTHMPDFPNVSKNNEYLMWRYDGIIVDGSSASVACVLKGNGDGAPSMSELSSYAAGQFVNHPPPGGSPNALQYSFNLDLRLLPRKWLSRVPNKDWESSSKSSETANDDLEVVDARKSRWFGFAEGSLRALEEMAIRQRVASANVASPGGFIPPHAVCNGLAIVATRDIQDEEVFINYRFNPSSPDLPSWYEDCDPDESRRRWAQEGFWG